VPAQRRAGWFRVAQHCVKLGTAEVRAAVAVVLAAKLSAEAPLQVAAARSAQLPQRLPAGRHSPHHSFATAEAMNFVAARECGSSASAPASSMGSSF